MSPLQRLLLLPLLSPLLAVLLLASINPRPAVPMRLLIWASPAWPLGAWIGGAAAAGAALSAAATGFALRSAGGEPQERRRVRRRRDDDRENGGGPQPSATADRDWNPAWAGPTRAAADPPPTVSVPFRVIRKGRSEASAGTAPGAGISNAANAAATDGDGWEAPPTDDW